MFRLKTKREVISLFQELSEAILQKKMDYTPASVKLAQRIRQAIANNNKKQKGIAVLL